MRAARPFSESFCHLIILRAINGAKIERRNRKALGRLMLLSSNRKKYRRKPMRWGWGLGRGRAAQTNEVRGEADAV